MCSKTQRKTAVTVSMETVVTRLHWQREAEHKLRLQAENTGKTTSKAHERTAADPGQRAAGVDHRGRGNSNLEKLSYNQKTLHLLNKGRGNGISFHSDWKLGKFKHPSPVSAAMTQHSYTSTSEIRGVACSPCRTRYLEKGLKLSWRQKESS